jgi:hypothetical protein
MNSMERFMASGRVAQWLLTRISTPERASAIVGDLLEEHARGLGFWLAVLRVGFALTWRWMLAVALAGASFLVVLMPYRLMVAPHRDFMHPEPWMTWAMYLVGAASCLGTSTAIAACLYGLQNRLTAMCAVLWLLAIAACVLTAQAAHATWMIAGGLGVVGCVMLMAGKTRETFLCAMGSAAAYGAAYTGLSRLFSVIEKDILVHGMGLPGLACCNDVHTFTVRNVVRVGLELSFGISVWLISVFAATVVLTRLRGILVRRSGTQGYLESI